MKAKLVIVLVIATACTDESGATRALQSSGFSDITITGYEVFGCGKDDLSATGFRAKSPVGRPVSGVVCCGLLKGCTVRF
jgi:hypothetical protein